MHGLTKVVNDNHVDNYLKEILTFLYRYYGFIVNNQPKNGFNVKMFLRGWGLQWTKL